MHMNEKEHLRNFIERIERLEEEKAALGADIKEVYAEAKSTGFDVKIIRKVIAIRKKDQMEFEEEEEMLAVYLKALGIHVTAWDGEDLRISEAPENATGPQGGEAEQSAESKNQLVDA